MAKEIESEWEFQKHIVSSKLTVINFYSDECGPCRAIAPRFERLPKEYTDVNFAKVNVDKLEKVAKKCNIRAMPTFKFFKSGQVVDEVIGARIEYLYSGIMRNK